MNIGFTFKFQTYYINQMERILIKYILIPGCIPFYKMLKKKKKSLREELILLQGITSKTDQKFTQ